MKGFRTALKIILFLTLLGGLFVLFCFIFQPVWVIWNNYDTVHGFYLEPENTIETVFLGPSTTVNGIAPLEVYEKYGYCTYNCGTEQQPMLASYYWLKEAYRLHPDSLKAVLLDPSSMRVQQEISFYQKAIDGMKLSPVKLEAVGAYQKSLNDTIEYSVPLLEYHDRWDQFEEYDDEKFHMKPKQETRGYHLAYEQYIDSYPDYQKLEIHRSWYDPEFPPAPMTDEALEYFDKTVTFCKEKGLHLAIVIPVRPTVWSAGFHTAYRQLAEEYDLPFYDLNASPLLEELDFVMGHDHKDFHLNYYGAVKLSDWIGSYLSEHDLNTDISGMEGYEYMDEQLDAWHALIERTISIHQIDNIADYLNTASKYDHCYVLISVRDEASQKLTDEQRQAVSELGLKKLAALDYRDSYIGVMKDGQVVDELRGEEKQEGEDAQITNDTKKDGIINGTKNDGVVQDSDDLAEGTKVTEGTDTSGGMQTVGDMQSEGDMQDAEEELYLKYKIGDNILIKSGGFENGIISSTQINGIEFSPNERGINVVIYDYETNEVYDSAVFDTYESPTTLRDVESGLQTALESGLSPDEMDDRVRKLYLYNRKTRNYQYADYWSLYGDETSVFAYLDPYLKNPGYTVFISVRDEAALSLGDEARGAFAQLGLQELSRLGTRECYIGILNDGVAYYEQRGLGAEPLRYAETDFAVLSGGFESGDISSIVVNGSEESRNKRGLNIVVYDRYLQQVVSSVAFDTHEVEPSVSLEKSVLNQRAQDTGSAGGDEESAGIVPVDAEDGSLRMVDSGTGGAA